MLTDTLAVSNQAHSGETLQVLHHRLRFDKLLSQAKPGDWLLIQFGHNDQKQSWPQTLCRTPALRYPAYLRAYIAEARAHGMVPILITSPERRNFRADGTLEHTLAAYVDAMKKVAAQEHVALIDLNAASRTIYQALGPDIAALAFNDGGKDHTHNDNYGAWMLARVIAAALVKTDPALAAHVASPYRQFDPAHPPRPADVKILPSSARSQQRPAGS